MVLSYRNYLIMLCDCDCNTCSTRIIESHWNARLRKNGWSGEVTRIIVSHLSGPSSPSATGAGMIADLASSAPFQARWADSWIIESLVWSMCAGFDDSYRWSVSSWTLLEILELLMHMAHLRCRQCTWCGGIGWNRWKDSPCAKNSLKLEWWVNVRCTGAATRVLVRLEQ